MGALVSWIAKARVRLESGRLSRSEYERTLALCLHLGSELQAVYAAVDNGDGQMVSMCKQRIAEAVKTIGVGGGRP
jgi:hypothetical protein